MTDRLAQAIIDRDRPPRSTCRNCGRPVFVLSRLYGWAHEDTDSSLTCRHAQPQPEDVAS